MKREDILELLRIEKVPFKFRTKDGTVITVTEIIDIGERVLAYKDKYGCQSYIGYDQITPPIQFMSTSKGGGNHTPPAARSAILSESDAISTAGGDNKKGGKQ